MSQVDRRHAAFAQLTLDCIVAGERIAECRRNSGRGSHSSRAVTMYSPIAGASTSVLRKVLIASSGVFTIASPWMFASVRGPVESRNYSTIYGMTRAGLEPATYG